MAVMNTEWSDSDYGYNITSNPAGEKTIIVIFAKLLFILSIKKFLQIVATNTFCLQYWKSVHFLNLRNSSP